MKLSGLNFSSINMIVNVIYYERDLINLANIQAASS